MSILEKNIKDEKFWLALCPGMSISNTPFREVSDAMIELDLLHSDRCKSRMADEGYYVADQVFEPEAMKLIADSIKILTTNNYPAAFIFMFNEPWQVFGRLAKIYQNILGADYQLRIGGIWAWNLDGNNQGFKPHRDSVTNESIKGGKLTNLTVWVPITNADADNGCMYVLPLCLDPHYPDNLDKMQMGNPKDIRAIPASAGSVLAWMQNIIHWGGTTSSWAKEPRISIAASFSSLETGSGNESYANDDINSPALALKATTLITLEDRLRMIASAIWYYGDRILESYPLISEELFEFSRHYATPDMRTKMDACFHNVILASQQHKAVALFKSQQYAKALSLFEQLCTSHPMDVKSRMWFGLTLNKFGRKDEALHNLQKAQQLQPDNTIIQRAIQDIRNGLDIDY